MPAAGRSGWTSKFSFKHRPRFSPVTARTDGFR
jgi:hypothetical protein